MFRLTIITSLSLIAFVGSSNPIVGQERIDQRDQERVRRDRQSLIDNSVNESRRAGANEKNAKAKLANEIETRVASLKELQAKLKAVRNSDRADSTEDARHIEREIERFESEIAGFYQRFRADNESSDRNNADQASDAQRQDQRRADRERGDVRENRDGQNREEAMHQLEHLMAAIPHLHESGMHDMARQLELRVDASKERLHADHNRRGIRGDDRMHDMMDKMMGEIKNLSEQVNQLRREVNQLNNNDRR